MSSNDENRLTHSPAADNIVNRFDDKLFIVYVEGKDDVYFWNTRFKKIIPSSLYKIIQVGGKPNLSEKIEYIKNKQTTNVVVACDSDFTSFSDNVSEDLILRTYGYSIENTMFCPNSVSDCIECQSCSSNDFINDVNSWFDEFHKEASKLLPYAIANEINPPQQDVDAIFGGNGENYYKYFINSQKNNLDAVKVDAFINNIKNKYDQNVINNIKVKITELGKPIRCIVQGHFLQKVVKSFIEYKIKQNTQNKYTLSNNIIATLANKCNCGRVCEDSIFLTTQINTVKNHFGIS